MRELADRYMSRYLKASSLYFVLAMLISLGVNQIAMAQDVGLHDKVAEDVLLGEIMAKEARQTLEQSGVKLTQYMIDRGDSWGLIAKRCGVPEELLKTLNPGVAECYAGMEIEIPVNPNFDRPAPNPENVRLHQLAEQAFKAGDYKKAVKLYGEIISKEPSAQLYFNRGLAQYNRKKWRHAAEDFDRARTFTGADDELKDRCDELYETAIHNHEVWYAERAQMVGGIISGVLAAGAATYAAVSLSKADNMPLSTYSYPMSNYGYSAVGNIDFQAVSNQIMQQTMMDYNLQQAQMQKLSDQFMQQAWAQIEAEHQNFLNNYMQYNPGATSEEAENAYMNYLSAQNNANMSGGNLSTGYSLDSDDGNQKVGDQKQGGYVYCPLCKGSGRCKACGGDKIANHLGCTYVCTSCNDSGQCAHCHGYGKVWRRYPQLFD